MQQPEDPETPTPPSFTVHRSRTRSHAQTQALLPGRVWVAVVVGFVPLGVVAYYQLGGGGSGRPLPVVPAAVDRVELGMTPEQVLAAGEEQDMRSYRGPVVYPQDRAQESGGYVFCGYPLTFPKNVIMGDVPQLRAELTFEDGGLVRMLALSEDQGALLDTMTALRALLEPLERLEAGVRLTLAQVEDELGPGLRVGRRLNAKATSPTEDVYRWTYRGVSDEGYGFPAHLLTGGRPGDPVHLNVYVTPAGDVSQVGELQLAPAR